MNSFKHLSNPEQALLSPEKSRGIQETRQDFKFDFASLLSTALVWYCGQSSICRAMCMVFGVVFSSPSRS